jgi:hypothetical protein
MAWEQRSDRRYYYRKVRRGGRVVSEYLGGGLIAQCAANLLSEEREEREAERQAGRERRAELEAIDRGLDEMVRQARQLAADALVAAGYHRHGGEWRRRRGR